MTPSRNINNIFIEKSTSLASIILKGLGQIMLQENPITGFLFLIGIFYGSFLMGVAALLATVCGTATALLLKYDKSEIDKGLYGFSAPLVGVALLLFLKPEFLCWLLYHHWFIIRNNNTTLFYKTKNTRIHTSFCFGYLGNNFVFPHLFL